jgi:hypothetical protein
MTMQQNYDFNLVNCDTDSIMVNKKDGSVFTKEEQDRLLNELNSLFPENIKWSNDGYYPNVIIVKAKNYVMVNESGKRTIKGSGLKATNKEKRFKRFIDDVINYMLTDRQAEIIDLYQDCVREICNIKDISEYCSKKTITKAVLEPKRTNEQRVKDALFGTPVQEGDKVYMFFKTETELCLQENFSGVYDQDTLLEKLFKTIKIFETVIDIKPMLNFTLKRNKKLLAELLDKK